MRRAGTRRKEKEVQTIQEGYVETSVADMPFLSSIGASNKIAVEILPPDIRDRLQLLGIPQNIGDLIINTMVEIPENDSIEKLEGSSTQLKRVTRRPLFALARDENNPTQWIYRLSEIIDVIRVYDIYRGLHTNTGEETSPVINQSTDPKYLTQISSEEMAFLKFDEYIKSLVYNVEEIYKKETVIPDVTVYEAPSLEDFRKQETLRNNLLTRKKIPVKNLPCKKCKQMEVYQEEFQLRAGDEGGTLVHRCGRCNHTWKI